MTVGAVAGGAFLVTRDSADDTLVEDSAELATDSNVDDTAAYSFAAATVSAQAAASVVFDMEIESPEGAMSAIASFDRASGRLSMDLDLSQSVADDEVFDIADEISIIVDEPSGTAFVSAGFLGVGFGPADGWVSLTSDEFAMDDESFGDVFSNPLDIADVFGDVEPLDLGEETIDGEVFRRFEVALDEAALAELDDDSFIAPDDVAFDGDVTYDVWVDESSQIRRIVFEAESDGETGRVDMWITVSADPIEIALPTPDEVVDLEELFASAFEDFDMNAGADVGLETDVDVVDDE